MVIDDQLFLAVIYHNPSDFPGMFVGRYHKVTATRVIPDDEPFAVGPTLEGVREAMAPGNDQRFDRSPDDDPTIVETWI